MSKRKRSDVYESFGGQREFMASYGLKLGGHYDHQEANEIADAIIKDREEYDREENDGAGDDAESNGSVVDAGDTNDSDDADNDSDDDADNFSDAEGNADNNCDSGHEDDGDDGNGINIAHEDDGGDGSGRMGRLVGGGKEGRAFVGVSRPRRRSGGKGGRNFVGGVPMSSWR
jgi:hypothetical protein